MPCFFANFATILVLQETRKNLIWGVPVHPAGRSGGFEGIMGGIFASLQFSFTPEAGFVSQWGLCFAFLQKKLAKFQENTIFFDLSAKPASRG